MLSLKILPADAFNTFGLNVSTQLIKYTSKNPLASADLKIAPKFPGFWILSHTKKFFVGVKFAGFFSIFIVAKISCGVASVEMLLNVLTSTKSVFLQHLMHSKLLPAYFR